MEKGFFASLFDFNFTNFVTPKVVKVLFIITLALLAIAYVVIGINFFTSGGGTEIDVASGTIEEKGDPLLGVLWFLVLGPLAMFIYTLVYRVLFELIIIVFRIHENTSYQASLLRAAHPEAAHQIENPVYQEPPPPSDTGPSPY